MDDKIFDKIHEVDLKERMETFYIDYAMSVIASRALPDVRDGLKPVQRRILYAMIELNNGPDKPHRISATVVTKIFRVGIIGDKIASRTVCRQVDGLGFGGREFAASIGRGIRSIVLFHCFSGEHIYSDTVVRFPSGVVCTRCHAYITVHMQGCRAAIPCCIAERRFIVTTTGQSDDGEC